MFISPYDTPNLQRRNVSKLANPVPLDALRFSPRSEQGEGKEFGDFPRELGRVFGAAPPRMPVIWLENSNDIVSSFLTKYAGRVLSYLYYGQNWKSKLAGNGDRIQNGLMLIIELKFDGCQISCIFVPPCLRS